MNPRSVSGRRSARSASAGQPLLFETVELFKSGARSGERPGVAASQPPPANEIETYTRVAPPASSE